MEEWRQMSLQAGAAAGQIRRQNMQSTCRNCRKGNALRRGRPLGRLRPPCFCMLPKKMGQLNDDLGEGGERECEEKGDQKQHCSINILPNSLNGMK